MHVNFPRLGRLLLAVALAGGIAQALPAPGGGGASSVGTPPPGTRRGGDGVGGIEKTAGPSSGPAGGNGGPVTGQSPTMAAEELPGTDVGGALAGSDTPVLVASGSTAANETLGLEASHALPFAPAALVLGTSELNLPFKGGTLVPEPDLLITGLVVDAQGGLALKSQVPDALPAGLMLAVQLWIADPLGPQGFAATNALEIAFP